MVRGGQPQLCRAHDCPPHPYPPPPQKGADEPCHPPPPTLPVPTAQLVASLPSSLEQRSCGEGLRLRNTGPHDFILHNAPFTEFKSNGN